MVLSDLSVTFIPTTVFKHSRKGKPFDNLYIDNMQTRNYALYHVLGNILPGKIGIRFECRSAHYYAPETI